jgi:hypothetical protein
LSIIYFKLLKQPVVQARWWFRLWGSQNQRINERLIAAEFGLTVWTSSQMARNCVSFICLQATQGVGRYRFKNM